MSGSSTRAMLRPTALSAALAAVMLSVMLPMMAGVAGASTPVVTISPAPPSGYFNDAQSVGVSVGPNSVFDPNRRVEIIECADPDGTAANLPTTFSSCDGDTHQGDTVIVQSDGSFSEPNYTMYTVPNARLGEGSTWYPVCNKTHYCVLYVGEDYNDFSQPKVFSKPFLFSSDPAAVSSPVTSPTTPGGGSSGTISRSATSSATGSAPTPSSGAASTVAVSPSVSVSSGTLAFTGLPEETPTLIALGLGCMAIGIAGRRLLRRWGR